MRLVLGRARFLAAEALLPRDELGEVDRMRVEVRTVDTRELHLAADADAARAAHAGAVDHDRVERDERLHVMGPRRLGARTHHRHRPDRDDEIRPLAFEQLGERRRDETRPAGAAVVRADDERVAPLGEPVLPEHEVGAAKTDDAGRAIARLLERPQLRIHRRDAEAAADQHDVPDALDVLRQAERPDEIGKRVTLGVIVAHGARRLAERLHDHGHRAARAVEIGHGERNALAALGESQHHEMTGLGRLRDVGRVDLPEECAVRELLAAGNRVHARIRQAPASSHSRRCAITDATCRR